MDAGTAGHAPAEAGVRRFVELPLDKHRWSPSPLLGQVVLVTTVDPAGIVDVAPKSWVTMVAFAGPLLGFGCNTGHRTYRNLEATGEFVVNVPDSALAEATWAMLGATDRLGSAGLTLAPGRTVAVPIIEQCRAHLECRLERTVAFAGGEVFVFGTVTAVAVDESIAAQADPADGYSGLDPFFFLENSRYATIGSVRQASPGA